MRQRLLTVAAALLLAPSLVWGAGFALFEHGARAMGMGGAFTAVADDPSALFWNPAGIAFQVDKGTQIMAGATFIFPTQDFRGENPYPGFGYESSQKSQVFFPAHAYMVAPLSENTVFGLSAFTPFGLGTWWPADYAGRFISKRVDIKTYDISPQLAYKIGDSFAVAIGADYMMGSIDLTRNLQNGVNPFTQEVADIGQVHLFTEGSGNDGWGWHASFLGKLGGGFSVGVLYRSKIKIDYEGKASFTQYGTGYPQYDALVTASIPFDHNPRANTSIDFPDFWSVGLAWTCDKLTISGQWGRMGWSSFQQLPLIFPDYPEFSETLEEGYHDADQYRLGLEYRASDAWAFQLGATYDETPQPRVSMSPLLGDANRTDYTAGVSFKSGKLFIDLSYMYVDVKDRCTRGIALVGYEGCYVNASANLVATSVGYSF